MVAACGLLAGATAGATAGADRTRAAPLRPLAMAADRDVLLRPWLGVDLADAGRLPSEEDLDELAALGVGLVRVDVRWAAIERAPGVVDWRALDAFAGPLASSGLRWVALVHASPAWSRHDPEPPGHWWLCRDARPDLVADADAAPPTDPADLATFAAALAARYDGPLLAVEVWREPNLMPNWRAGGPDPEDYGRLLQAVTSAVHGASTSVDVVSAAPAPTTELDPCAMDDVVFLRRLARTGALDAVDAVGIAPLGFHAPPDALPDPDALGVGRAELHHLALSRAGVAAPLWALSFGWASMSAPPDSPDGGSRGAVSPAQAAQYLGEAWARAARDWPWLEAAFVWGLELEGAAPAGASAGKQPLVVDGRRSPLAASVAAIHQGIATAAATEAAGRAGAAGAVAAALAAAALALLALRARAWTAPRLHRLLDGPRAWPLPALAIGYLAATIVLSLSAGCPPAAAWCAAGLPWPAGVPALVALALLASARPSLATAAVAAALPFAHAVRLAIGPLPVATVELLVALALGGRLVAWYAATGPPRRIRLSALDVAVIALVLWAAFTPAWAPRPAEAWREWRTVLLEPALFYGLLRTAPRPREAASLALLGLAAGGTLAAALGLGQVALGALGVDAGVVAAEGVLRARGPYRSPNNLALLVGRVAMLLSAFALAPGVRPRVRLGARGALAVASLGHLATFSRGAVLLGIPAGALAVSGWLAPPRRKRRALAGLAAVAIGVAALLVPFAGTERVAGALSAAPGSTGYYRLQLWRSATRMALDHPFKGVGLDGFLYAYRETYVARDVIQERFLSHPHNIVLDWWTRLGLPGLVVLAVLVAGHVAVARTLARQGGGGAVVAGALGMQAYGAAHGLIDNSFFLVDLAAATWLAQAALLAERSAAPHVVVREGVGPPGFEPGTYRL